MCLLLRIILWLHACSVKYVTCLIFISRHAPAHTHTIAIINCIHVICVALCVFLSAGGCLRRECVTRSRARATMRHECASYALPRKRAEARFILSTRAKTSTRQACAEHANCIIFGPNLALAEVERAINLQQNKCKLSEKYRRTSYSMTFAFATIPGVIRFFAHEKKTE